jgi:tetratricopeptide (TPR) repeat protein
MIRNVPRGERKPTIVVYLRNGGAQIDKYQTNDLGYWYFLRTPVDGHTLNFEIDGIEVGRTIIAGGISNRFRQDIELDWNQVKGSTRSSPSSGVVSARDRYERSADSETALQKALSEIRAKKDDEALKLLTSIVEKDPKDYNAWMYLGTIYYSAKRNDEARAAYKRALELKPDYFLANLNLGRLEVSQKQFDPAIAALVKAVEIDAASADANHLLGEAYLQNKKGSLAVGYLNKAIELAPVEKAELHLRLAALYNAAGLKDRAALEYKAFLAKVKDHPDRAKFEQYVKDNLPKT